MKRRFLSALLILLLALGALPIVGRASPATACVPEEGEPSVYIDPEYGVFIEDDSDYCDYLPSDQAEVGNTKGTYSMWELENSIWLDALEYVGYPVQRIHDAGYLFNTNTNGWYGKYTYKYWKGMGTDETNWTFRANYPKNYAEAVSAWSQSNVTGSLVRMASVGSAGGTDGLFYKGYAPSTITFGTHSAGAGVAYKSGSSAVMEKPWNWKKEYIQTDQGYSVQRGIVCASMASYVYFNYLPTVRNWTKLGIGNNWHYKTTSYPVTNAGLRLPYAYNNGSLMVSYNSCTCLDWAFSHSSWAPYVDTGTCTNQTEMINALNQAVPGTILLFRYGEVENGEFITPDPLAHAAIYLGKWDGTHYVLQTASIRGPEIQTVDTKLIRDEPPLLSRYILPPPYVRVKITSKDADALSDVPVTVTYTNPGASAATWTGKSVRKTDRDGKAYGEVLMPMCYLKENASVTVTASKSGVSFPNGNTVKIQKVKHGENLVELSASVSGKAIITVSADDLDSHTYQFRLTETTTGVVRTAESKSNGKIRVTDGGACTSDKTAFLIGNGSYRLTEVEPGRYAPSSIKVTEVSADGTRTQLGSWSAKTLAANSTDPKSYRTPVFKTSVLNKGGYLEIQVTNQHPTLPTGNLTGSDGTHQVPYSRCAAVRDQVKAKNLVPGHVYRLRGYLVDVETGQSLKKNGAALYVETDDFTATATQMDLELNFTVDTRNYSGKKLAVKEYLNDQTLDMRVTSYSIMDDDARQVTVGAPRTGKVAITVTASDISSHTYQFTLTDTAAGAVRTAESKSNGKIRVTDGGACTSDQTAFLLKDGTYRLTEVEPGRFAPAPITVTEVAPDGTRTQLGSWSAKTLAANSTDPKSYATPAFTTHVLNEGGYLEIQVANQHPSMPAGNLTGSDGTHAVPYSRCAAFCDRVTAKNLVPGHVYLLRGYLVDLETGERLNQKFQTGNFTATAAQMDLELSFTVDTRPYSGKKLAIQEYLFDRTLDMRVTQYALLDDPNRQVTVGAPQTGKVAVTVSADDLASHTYQLTLTDTAAGAVRTAESRSNGKIRVTDGGACTSDKTAFLLKDGTYRLTEVEPGRYAPSSIKVTEVAPDGTRTQLGSWSAKTLAANSADPKSYATPAFTTHVLNEGGYLEIQVTNQHPFMPTGNLTGTTGTHEISYSRCAAVRDRVTAQDLVPGHVYRLRGYLVDVETGQSLKKNGAALYVETDDFTATATQMDLELNFTVDTRNYSGKKLAVKEYLNDQTLDMRVTQYSILDDEARQVTVNPALPIDNPFVDVPNGAWYAAAVLWAWNGEITEGVNATHFAPGLSCTRSQAVTFLWRAMGCPKPKTTTLPFTDVPKDAYYRKAVLWATDAGVTTGVSAASFAPNRQVSRAEFVTFLWRAAGESNPKTGENPFEDVAANSWYEKAVLWAVEQGITNGVTKTRFCPNQVCTRAEVVTFLYRQAQTTS